MFRPLLCIFLLAHLLGDFYFQSSNLAKKKKSNYAWLMFHGLAYLSAGLLTILPYYSTTLLINLIILAALHLTIDSLKFFLTKSIKNRSVVYLIDQLLHLLCIVVVALVLPYHNYQLALIAPLTPFSQLDTVNELYYWLTLLLLVVKPASLTIRILLSDYRCQQDPADGIKNAGALIGILERIIILLFLSIQQYSAIGLVLTAKSVARYNKIAEDKQFAEYYLLGTLLSTLFVLAGYLLLS